MEKIIAFVAALVFFPTLTYSEENILAQEKSNNIIKVESIIESVNSITINWDDAEHVNNIYRDGERLHTGSDNKIIDTDLKPGYIYTYIIEALDTKGKILDVVKIQTSTEATDKNIDDSLGDMVVTTIGKNSYVTIDWDDIEYITSYEIFRNDEHLTTVMKSEFTDHKITLDEEYTYKIVGTRKVKKDKRDKIDKDINNDRLQNEQKEELYIEEFEISKYVGAMRNHIVGESEDVMVQDLTKRWEIRYTTFLKDEWVKNPNGLSKYKWFSGDNRGYNATSLSYRTRTYVNICFCSASESVMLDRDVGTTHGYDANKKLLNSDTASEDGIVLINVDLDSAKIKFDVDHAVGNPLVASLDINYELEGEFYSNGNYKLSGEHDQAPHHEVYLKGRNSSSWETVYKAASKGIEWLAPPFANKKWTKSNF
ncbi:hypothetical protein [Cytobacillus sp. IB215665]|uniref:hypothetical protein n=1 Tax=Cytobacillus sp. IB215665 TaxID=3097357 RepID=UPI002A0F2755|nr:hypothetical protein [Cytobacillus sp. IB215665]MDX8365545.1 hypothetical protein [Cytobacillus sp. IB215665]